MEFKSWLENHWWQFQETVTLFHGTSSAFADKIRSEGLKPPDDNLEDYVERIVKTVFGEEVPEEYWQKIIHSVYSIRRDNERHVVGSVIYLSTAFEEAASYAKAYYELGGEIAHDIFRWASIYANKAGLPEPRKPLEGSYPIVVKVEIPHQWMKTYYGDLKQKKSEYDRWYDSADKGFKSYEDYMDKNAFEVRVKETIPPSMIRDIVKV